MSTPTESEPLTGTCHCGLVTITVPSLPTRPLNECQCSICRRYGALWMYFQVEDVKIDVKAQADKIEPDTSDSDQTHIYLWRHKHCAFHRCKECGVLTYWSPTEKSGVSFMGVNARILEKEVLGGLERKLSPGPE